MIGLLAAIALILLGATIRSELLIVFGFIAVALQLVLDRLKSVPQPVAQAAARPRMRHRLLNAPQDAWKVQEDDIWQALMSGPSPMSIGGSPDFMNLGTAGLSNPHTAGALRAMLPFQNYGRQGPLGAIENMFIGMPISLGNFFNQSEEHRHFPYSDYKQTEWGSRAP